VLFKGTTDYLDQIPKLRFNTSNEFSSRFKEIASETPALVAAMATSLGVDSVTKIDQVEIINQAASTRIATQLDPSLFDAFLEYLDDRTEENPDGKIAALYYDSMCSRCDYDSYSEDEYFDELENTSCLEYSNVDHGHMMDLICRTAAFPIDSSQTLDLVAMCAFLASRFPELAADYFKALALYISRRHDLETRTKYMEYETKINSGKNDLFIHFKLADDITMLWTFFWMCVVTANDRTLLPSVNPMEFIRMLQSSKPLFNILPTNYTERLAKCTKPIQLANVFLVYGNRDPDREKECRDAYHAYYQLEKGEKGYSTTLTDVSFTNTLNFCRANGVYSLETDRYHAGFQDELERLALVNKERLLVNVIADEEYCFKHVLSIPTDRPVVAIKSACGTGKSVQMLQYIDSMDNDIVIICITHRKALSAEIQKRTSRTEKGRFELYSNIDGVIDLNQHKYLICEYESLGRIRPYDGKICIIIDEVNSVLHQTQSAAGDPQAAHMVFSGLMQDAHRVLLMDAFLDQARVNVIQSYVNTEPYVICNTYKPNTDHEIWHTSNEAAAKQKLLSLLEQGENVIVPCVLKKQAEEIYHLVCSVLDPNVVQLYTSESRWQNGDDVNKVWSKARVVIYTATMDSGHSFELDHFGWAVCFFSNTVPIPVEACLQMKARSRQTKRFLICIEQIRVKENPIMSSIESIVAHVYENQRQMANECGERYFGRAAYWCKLKEDEYPTCPYLNLHATVQRLQYLSARHYRRLMCEMLAQDGVQDANVLQLGGDGQDVKEAIKNARKEAKDNSYVPTAFSLAEIYAETDVKTFESMDDDTRRFYGQKKTIQAYHNRMMLHNEGTDFLDSVKNLQNKEERIIAALAVCRSTGDFDENSILNTEIQLGLHLEGRCTASVVERFRISSELCKIFTGKSDPFEIVSISFSNLCENLMCVPRDAKKVSSTKTIYEINADLSRMIEEYHLRYCLRLNVTRRSRSRNDPLSMTEGMTLLNDVLQLQFGIKLKRTRRIGTEKSNGKTGQEFIYELDDSFTQFSTQMDTNPMSKPIVAQWNNNVSLAKDTQLLDFKKMNGKFIVSYGAAFYNWWKGSSEAKHGYMPVTVSRILTQDISTVNSKAKRQRMQDTVFFSTDTARVTLEVLQTSKTMAEKSEMLSTWMDNLEIAELVGRRTVKDSEETIAKRKKEALRMIPYDQAALAAREAYAERTLQALEEEKQIRLQRQPSVRKNRIRARKLRPSKDVQPLSFFN